MKKLTKSDLQILKSIQLLETPTRQAVSTDVKLSLQKISKVLISLEERDLIRKAGKSVSVSGRPSCIYEIYPENKKTKGV